MVNNFIFKKTFKNPAGTVLLLSLLILAVIISTSGLLATVVLQQLKMSKNIEDSILAFYAAETGIERGLYILRKTSQGFTEVRKSNQTLDNGAIWETDNSETTNSVPEIVTGIAQNQVLQLNLYDLDNPLHPELGLGYVVQSIFLEEEIAQAGAEWAEVSWISWGSDGTAAGAKTRLYSSSQLITSEGGVSLDFDPNAVGHVVRIKALYDDIVNLRIEAYDDEEPANQVNIPGQVAIKSIGKFGNATQSLKMSFLQRSPMFGLYDFIIFSEESLLK